MAITPNFRPAQHVYQSTYQPLPFEEIAGLGMYMQGKADKARESSYAYDDSLDVLPSTVSGGDVAVVKGMSESYKDALAAARNKSPMGSIEFENAFRAVKRDAASKAGSIMEMQRTKAEAEQAAARLEDMSLRPWEKESTARKIQQYEQFGTYLPTGEKVKFDTNVSNYLDVDLFKDAEQFFADTFTDENGNVLSGVLMEDISDRYGIVETGAGYNISMIPNWVKDRFDTELTERAVSSLEKRGKIDALSATDPKNTGMIEREKLNIYKEEVLKSVAPKITRSTLVAGGRAKESDGSDAIEQAGSRTDFIDTILKPIDASINQADVADVTGIEKHSPDKSSETGTYGHKRFGDSDNLLLAVAVPGDVENANKVTVFKENEYLHNTSKGLRETYENSVSSWVDASNNLKGVDMYSPNAAEKVSVYEREKEKADDTGIQALNGIAKNLGIEGIKPSEEYVSTEDYYKEVERILEKENEFEAKYTQDRQALDTELKANGFERGIEDVDDFYKGLQNFTVWASKNFKGDFNVNPGSGTNKKHISVDGGVSRPGFKMDLVMTEKEIANKLGEWALQLPEEFQAWAGIVNYRTIKTFRNRGIDLLSGKYYTTGDKGSDKYSISVWDIIDPDKNTLRNIQKKKTGALSGDKELLQNQKLDDYILGLTGNTNK